MDTSETKVIEFGKWNESKAQFDFSKMEKWTKNWPNTYFSLEFGQKNYALLLLRQNNRKSTFQFRKCINGFILNDLLMFIFFQIFHYSVKNGCQWYDCLSTADQGTKVAMATNILKISVQKLQTRFHYFYTSAINVRIISTNIQKLPAPQSSRLFLRFCA